MMRREFSTKVRLAAFQRAQGHCENATCQAKLRPGKFAYDHVIPDQLGGEPLLSNCMVICDACHTDKTKTDQGDIAKAKRRELRQAGIKKPRTIRTWRRFDGTLVRAGRER